MRTRRDVGRLCLAAGTTIALAGTTVTGALAQAIRDKAARDKATRSKGGKRVALVVGVQEYDAQSRMPPLVTPVADATAVGEKLQKMGFEVIQLINPTSRELFQGIARLTEQAREADMAAVYYAGHGIQATRQGAKLEQIFVPKDFREPESHRDGRDAAFEAAIENNRILTLGKIKQQIEVGKTLCIVFWDACRVNPLSGAQIALSTGERQASVSGGRMRSPDPGAAPGGERASPGKQPVRIDRPYGFIVHNAAESGKLASDGTGRHSPFATALLANLDRPGLELMAMLGVVGTEVNRLTSGEQTPSIEGNIIGPQVVLVPARAGAQASGGRQSLPAGAGSGKVTGPGRESTAKSSNGTTYQVITRETSPFE